MKIIVWSEGKAVINADPEYQEAPIRSVLAKVAAGESNPEWIRENILNATDTDKSNISHGEFAVVTEDDGVLLWAGWLTGDQDAPPPAGALADLLEAKRREPGLPAFEAALEAQKEAGAGGLLNWAATLIVAAAEGADVTSEGWRGQQRDWLSAFNATPPPPPAASALRNGKKLAIALDALRDIRKRCAGSGQGLAIEAHGTASTALDRIAALGPSLEEITETDTAAEDGGYAEDDGSGPTSQLHEFDYLDSEDGQ